MNLKTYLKSKLTKISVPDVKTSVIKRMAFETLVSLEKKRNRFNPFLMLKMVSSFVLVMGMTLTLIPLFSNQVNAFTAYDEVMMQSSTSVYALYEAHMSPVEETTSVESHTSLLRSQLKTMLKYAYTFERFIQTQRNFKLNTHNQDGMYGMQFEVQDAFLVTVPLHIQVEKAFNQTNKNAYDFEGTFESFDVLGDLRYVNERHLLNIAFSKDAFKVVVVYDDLDASYHIQILQNDVESQSFKFQIVYDAFDRPTLIVEYVKDSLLQQLIINRSIASKEMTIAYTMKHDYVTHKGIITFKVLGGVHPRYHIEIRLDEGEIIQFQFIRPRAMHHSVI